MSTKWNLLSWSLYHVLNPPKMGENSVGRTVDETTSCKSNIMFQHRTHTHTGWNSVRIISNHWICSKSISDRSIKSTQTRISIQSPKNFESMNFKCWERKCYTKKKQTIYHNLAYMEWILVHRLTEWKNKWDESYPAKLNYNVTNLSQFRVKMNLIMW